MNLCTLLVCDSVYAPPGSGLDLWAAWQFCALVVLLVVLIELWWWDPAGKEK